jgi:hypothetical protein
MAADVTQRIVLLGAKMIGITRDSAADLDCEQISALGRQAVTLLRALSAPAQGTTVDGNGSTNSYTVDRSPKSHSGSSGIDSTMRAIVEAPLSTIVDEMMKRSKALTEAGQLDGECASNVILGNLS